MCFVVFVVGVFAWVCYWGCLILANGIVPWGYDKMEILSLCERKMEKYCNYVGEN